jgi:DNA segregation ATPase FtsK/SpoIIIE-like protein
MAKALRSSSTRKSPTTSRKAKKSSGKKAAKKIVVQRVQAKSQDVTLVQESMALVLTVMSVFLFLALCSHLSPETFAHFNSLLSQTASSPEVSELAEAESSANLMGRLGHAVASFLMDWIGWCSFVTAIWALLLARRISKPQESQFEEHPAGSLTLNAFGAVCMLGSCATIASVIFGAQGGGILGSSVALFLVQLINEAGTLLLSLAVFILALGITTGFGFSHFSKLVKRTGSLLSDLLVDMVFFFKQTARWAWRGVEFVSRGIADSTVQSLEDLRSAIAHKRERAESVWDEDLQDVDDVEDKPSKAVKTAVAQKVTSPKKDVDSKNDDFVLGDDLSTKKAEQMEFEPLISRRSLEYDQKLEKEREKAKEDALAKKKSRNQREYKLPPLDLLVGSGNTPSGASPQDDELIENSRRLEVALQNFRIGGNVLEVHPGPVVTLYEFEPAAGIKVQRVISLADDLALALKVASVRVYAPVPGKGTVGIEVPNSQREMVRLRDVLESPGFHSPNSPLNLALAKDTFGDPFLSDLSKMPHLLIAGATGTGKSVCINSLILSLLFRNTPDDMRLILIDPKMLELSVYEDIPHLKAPVVTQAKRARGVLHWAVEEMERRYTLMKELGVRNLSMYNRAVVEQSGGSIIGGKRSKKEKVIELEEKDVVATGSPFEGLDRKVDAIGPARSTGEGYHEELPRIVIIVDELADLMLTVGREIEELLTRLAQKARAAGIHLILATQRPSVNVITGLIKANFPARLSFKVASKIDGRTILDTGGSERLLGQGDMLFFSPSIGRIVRLHGPFVSDHEVHDVVDWIRQQGSPEYDETIERMITKLDEPEKGAAGPTDDPDYDEFYDKAVQLVVDKGQASTSMVQRAFRIGYNRAARILETMERDGVVGPSDGAKPRQVLLQAPDEMI